MSDKMECPGCESYTSGVLGAFERGEDCPYCGLPASAALAVIEVRERGANEAITERAVQGEIRAARAETRAAQLAAIVRRVQEVVSSEAAEVLDR